MGIVWFDRFTAEGFKIFRSFFDIFGARSSNEPVHSPWMQVWVDCDFPKLKKPCLTSPSAFYSSRMRMVASGSKDPAAQGQAPIDQAPRWTQDCLTVLVYCVAIFQCLPCPATADETWLPSSKLPVEVAAGFFLANLSGAAERSETFEADLYLTFRWHDPRLAFAGTEPKRFLEEAAVQQLQRMWWPQLEFINTGTPDVANRTLDIAPDGSVTYKLSVTATFRSDLDLRRFPFDRETLEVRIQSFTWTRDQMIFVSDPARIGFNPRSTYEELDVSKVSSEVRQRELTGWTPAESYSEFAALIEVKRRPIFYLWTVFAPVTLIFLISCAIFAVDIENLHDPHRYRSNSSAGVHRHAVHGEL